jgi:hypothetical protein
LLIVYPVIKTLPIKTELKNYSLILFSNRPTSRLHIAIPYKSTLARSTACLCAAHGLQIWLADKAALAATTSACCSAIGLFIGVLNKSALA